MIDRIHKGYADIAAGQVHYRRVAGPGVPIVLLHRTPASSASFAAMLRRFAGVRAVVAFDTPGFGQSFRPDGHPDTRAYAGWFLDALDALGIGEFHLCPHHTGTHFAVEMAVLAPARVRSLLLNGVMVLDREYRLKMREDIGNAAPVDPAGAYLTAMWRKMVDLFPDYDPALVHAETLGALNAMEQIDKAFDAIVDQDFDRVLAQVACPFGVVQASDDPLDGMLARVRGRYPALAIRRIGPAYLAAPECQADAYAAAALAFATLHDTPQEEPPMTDRRFELVRHPAGFDLHETRMPVPVPGPGEVLLRVRAVSLNRRDIMIRELTYPVGEADHFTPMSDAAGEIAAIGEGVSKFAVGDRVCSTFFQNWADGRITFPAVISALGAGGPGVLAEHVLLREEGVAAIPDDWSFEEGASISCAGLTAWSALMPLGHLQRGDWVLVLGTGGVAIFALQIAVAAGAKVAILSSSDEKLERARALGASATINYRTTPDWEVAVREATKGGVQHVIELGGEGTLAKSIASAAIGGHIALIGALDGFGGEISGAALVMAALRVSAVVCGSHADHVEFADFLVQHEIRPVIDSFFDLDHVADAYARADAGAFGKVVIRVA